jgi:hypothetical protein
MEKLSKNGNFSFIVNKSQNMGIVKVIKLQKMERIAYLP